MATKSTPKAPERSEAITVTSENSAAGNLLAAWQGVYNLFGGRADFRLTDEGIVAENFSVEAPYDPAQIVQDISHRTRRLDFYEVMPWFNGQAPEPFTDAKSMTAWSVQFLRGSVEENSSRTPKYVRDAFAAYKNENNFAKRRGPKKKIFRADNLGDISVDTLQGVDADVLAKLQATLEAALAASTSNTTGESTSTEAAASA